MQQFGLAISAAIAIILVFCFIGSDPGIYICECIVVGYGLLVGWQNISISGMGISVFATLFGYGILLWAGITDLLKLTFYMLPAFAIGLTTKLIVDRFLRRPARE
jgi:hypothetical protein